MRGLQRTEQRHPRLPGLGCNREAAQLLVARAGEPGEQRMAAPGAQHLLGGPQRIAAPGRAHYGKMGEVQAGRRERRRIGQMRRRQPDDALACPGKCRERRQHELQLAYAFTLAQDLAQAPGRPAAAGQLAVERGKPAWDRRQRAGKRAAAPHRMLLQDFFQGRHELYLYTVPAGRGSRGLRDE